MLWLFNTFFSSVFLLSIVLSIPVAFDVGGRDSGLAYSLALSIFYLVYSSISLATPDKSRFRWAVTTLLRISQWVVIPALLIWALGQFAVDVDANTSSSSSSWVERTIIGGVFQANTIRTKSWNEWLFGKEGLVETVMLGVWDNILRYAGPAFQLLEGFCTLLVIQAAGQITRWLVNRGRSDTWVILLLALSGSIIASAVYFLWRVAQFPQINNVDAALIGVAVTTSVFLCAYGIGSGRGNPIESSLLFAYVVLCVYQIFTDYLPSDLSGGGGGPHDDGYGYGYGYGSASPHHPENNIPPLPPIIMASYSTLLHVLGSLPLAMHSSLALLYAAFQTITPSVIISLAYRLLVFYCATRIIPSVRDLGAQALMHDPNFDDAEASSMLLNFISHFAPSILISVYTSLLLQHFSTSDGPDGWTLRGGDVGGSTWRWINIGITMVLYGVELYLGKGEQDHWKVD